MIMPPPPHTIVAVKEVANTVPKHEWHEDRLLPGDIIQRISAVPGLGIVSPFIGGKAGLEHDLRQIFKPSDQLLVLVKRGPHTTLELKACVIPEESVIPKKHYTLRHYDDFRHVVQLVDSTEQECMRWQESTRKTLRNGVKRRLSILRQQENLLPYAWAQKMQAFLPVDSSSMIFSILFMPFQASPDRLVCKDVEDTAARAMAWFSSAQASGIPVIFVSIQTELVFNEVLSNKVCGILVQEPHPRLWIADHWLLRSILQGPKDGKNSYFTASTGSIQQLKSCGRYNVACSETTVLDVAKALRVWYVPAAAEVPVTLIVEPGESRFGLSLATTEEGFCYVSGVDERSAADRAGVKALLETAGKAGKLLVVSRVGDEKVVPWLVSLSGDIHCPGDTAIRQHLTMERECNKQARIHLMVWENITSEDQTSFSSSSSSSSLTTSSCCNGAQQPINHNNSRGNNEVKEAEAPASAGARPRRDSSSRRTVSWGEDVVSSTQLASA